MKVTTEDHETTCDAQFRLDANSGLAVVAYLRRGGVRGKGTPTWMLRRWVRLGFRHARPFEHIRIIPTKQEQQDKDKQSQNPEHKAADKNRQEQECREEGVSNVLSQTEPLPAVL